MTRIACLTALFLALVAPGAAAQSAQPTPPPTTVDASSGGVTITSGNYSLSIGARAQVRWTLEDREQLDADTAGRGLGLPDGAVSEFDVPRLRLSLSGGAYRPWLRYAFQFEMSRTSGEGSSRIKDAVLEIRPHANYRVQTGQFKVPFGLQQLTSSGRQQFVDRAITDSKFNPARDMGVTLSGTSAARTFGFDIGLFNGSGESVRQANASHLWVGRVYVDPLGPYTLAEGATDGRTAPVLHLGAAVRGGEAIRGRTPAAIVEDADNQLAYNVEFAFKAARFYSTAEHFWMRDERANPAPGPDLDSRGYHVQAGYMVVPRTTEVGVRYAEIQGDTDVDDAALREIRGVVGYYFAAHNLKLQADIGQLRYGANVAGLPARARQGLPSLGTRLVSGAALADTQLRVQFQLSF